MIIASFFWFRSFNLDVYEMIRVPVSLALSSCHYVLRPRPARGLPEACPRPALGEPRSASNANKLASSWPLKQGRKKCSKHGCDRGTSTVLPRKSLTETNTMDGCIFPYETRGVPPLFVSFVGDGMFGSLSLAYNASPLSSLAPPLRGDLISLHHGFEIAADSQEDDYYVHEGP